MSVDELIDLIEENHPLNIHYLNLLNAINDWPREINCTIEYFKEIKEFLKIDKIETEEIIKVLQSLKYKDFGSWKLESISELIVFLNYDNKKK